jgi:GWxTD domain-containing protein
MPMLPPLTNTILRRVVVACALAALACGGRAGPVAGKPAPGGGGVTPGRTPGVSAEFDAVRLYAQMGFLSAGAPMPFVGGVSYLATAVPDSTNLTVGISITNSALSYSRDNDRFVAGYTVSLTLRQGGTVVRDIDAHESVRVASYKETGRGDESVIFQQGLTVTPGQYALAVSVRDDGSGRTSTQEMLLTVPRLGDARSMSTPIPFLQVVPRRSRGAAANLVSNTRAMAIFGRDTAIALYVEGYGAGDRFPVAVEARNDEGRVIWRDTASLPRRDNLFSGVVWVPVSKIGIGVAVISMWPAAGADSVRAPVFVSFGEELPVAKFEDMIAYLRWFAAPYRLKALRDTNPEARPGAWVEFVKTTDPSPETPANEELNEYFGRLLIVTARFREEGMPGWKTDRGKVFLGLGEPAQVFDQGIATVGDRGRAQVWEYRNLNMQLVFYDQTGFGRWRLTNASESVFQSQWLRRMNR